jgi:ribonucleoside-triphosphate reductase (thioredoxin)
MLSKEFLAPYVKKGDNFPSLLARASYLSKYKRPEDANWTATIQRVVEGNCAIDPSVTELEAALLFHIFWTMQALPPGRGLWVGGVPNIPNEAAFNCYFTTIYGVKDWGWVANQLMLGGGVGVGLEKLHTLPAVKHGCPQLLVTCVASHPDFQDVHVDIFGVSSSHILTVEDSREGWVDALIHTLVCAWEGKSAFFDVSNVRQRGALIRTFGGTACGPGPLVDMLRSVWTVVRGATGRKLTTVEGLDVTNFIGKCVKAGNVRRSALIALGAIDDQEFRDAKKHLDAILSHRHTSNNTLNFHTFEQFDHFDWVKLVQDNIEYGEPGVDNLALGKLQDPLIEGINPCGEVQLRNRESCNLAEVFPALFDGSVEPEKIFRLVTRYTLRQRMLPFADPIAEQQRKDTMRLGVGLGGICDFDWTEDLLRSYYTVVRKEANAYADYLGVNRPIATTVVKPSGTISLLNGSNPGIHAGEAPFYLRRMRISDVEPMANSLRKANVPCEPDRYDTSGHTLVFSFPMKARNSAITVQTQTLEDQFERQLKVQRSWADNAVSSTIKFAKEEAGSMAQLLTTYAPKLKSLSMLPKEHGYQQAPYEAITEASYEQLFASIDNQSMLDSGDLQIDECEHGSCPIR